MYEIIASIDRDVERAESQAEAILDLPLNMDETEVTIVHCFSDNEEGASINQLRSVRHAEDTFEDAGVDVTLIEDSSDTPGLRIIEIADERNADLIVVAGRKRSPTKKALFGSVSQQLLLNTDRSVLVCGEIEG